jgi:hypothetical protein
MGVIIVGRNNTFDAIFAMHLGGVTPHPHILNPPATAPYHAIIHQTVSANTIVAKVKLRMILIFVENL